MLLTLYPNDLPLGMYRRIEGVPMEAPSPLYIRRRKIGSPPTASALVKRIDVSFVDIDEMI